MKQKRKLIIVFASVLCIILLCSVGYDVFKKHKPEQPSASVDTETKVETAYIAEEKDTAVPEVLEKEEKATNTEHEIDLPEPENLQPVITEPVIPKDIYVLPGEEGKIKCYYPDALAYNWEYYNETEREWLPISDNPIILLTGETDEFNRSISTLVIKEDDNNGLMIRCSVLLPEEEEEKIYQATYNILSFTADEIKQISIPESNKEAGTYISTQDIPVTITLNNDSTETVTGLSSLFFCAPKNVSSDTERNGDGTTIETVKTTTLESEYWLINAGENKMLLRYRGTEPGMDAEANIEGTDSLPPEVTIALSDYTVSNTANEGVSIIATITATDNYSPLTKLLYAFVPEGQKLTEDDFDKRSRIEIEAKKNEIWTAYVKDEIGNTGSADVEIIIVDQKVPVIESVVLNNQDAGWFKENKIIVTASDKTALQYCYLCEEYSMDSGWVDAPEYEINQNGTWKVIVKDAAGNESEKEITVTNVDATPPVILSIEPKNQEPEQTVIDTGTLEDRVSVMVNGATVKDADSVSTASTTGSNSLSYSTTSASGISSGTNILGNSSGGTTITSTGKGEKGDKGEKGAAGAVGTAGTNGKDGTSYYMHVKYAENATGANMSDAPNDGSKYIGVYTGTSSYAPSSASSYKWSQYKGNSSQLYIRYSENPDGSNMTENPSDTSNYMGICSTTETTAPSDPLYYTWSKYKDSSAVSELQEQIADLQKQINELKAP